MMIVCLLLSLGHNLQLFSLKGKMRLEVQSGFSTSGLSGEMMKNCPKTTAVIVTPFCVPSSNLHFYSAMRSPKKEIGDVFA